MKEPSEYTKRREAKKEIKRERRGESTGEREIYAWRADGGSKWRLRGMRMGGTKERGKKGRGQGQGEQNTAPGSWSSLGAQQQEDPKSSEWLGPTERPIPHGPGLPSAGGWPAASLWYLPPGAQQPLVLLEGRTVSKTEASQVCRGDSQVRGPGEQ